MSQKKFVARFSNDDRGVVVIIFALLFVFIVGIAGLAVDAARYYSTARHIEGLLDATAIMAAKLADTEELSDQQIADRARNFFDQQAATMIETRNVTISQFQLTHDGSDGSVEINFRSEIPTTLLKAVQVDSLTLERVAAVNFSSRRIEVSLVLDTTGSMCDPCAKLDALKEAAKSLVDVLYNDETPKGFVRVALVPYATTVNVGNDYFVRAALEGGIFDDDGAPCVIERQHEERYTDAGPVNGNDVSTKLHTSNPRFACVSAPLIPLSDLRKEKDRDDFKSEIDALTAQGWTAGHIGVAWGWYTISPEWHTLWPNDSRPNPYGRKNNIKATVIMSDGRFNTAYSAQNENSESRGDVLSSGFQALQLCSAMRAAGIQVYTITFQAPAEAEAMLEECAGSTENFYNADTANQLINAFRDVATKLKSMRVAQ
ncbi:MAG: pilus assembly protein [Pseudomonadota bacterium]